MIVKTKCRMKWCYSPLRHEDGTWDKFCFYNTKEVKDKMRLPLYGRWIKKDMWSEGIGMGESYGYYYECSECGRRVQGGYDKCGYNFCPHCGADMSNVKSTFTNIDRIRCLSPAQLATWLNNIVECGDDCPAINECAKREEMGFCYPCLLEWLGKEVSE